MSYRTRSKGKVEKEIANPPERKKRDSSNVASKPRASKKAKTEATEPIEKASTKQEASEPEILEKGLLYFFYRPKIDSEEVKGIDDVAKLYLLLSPHALEKDKTDANAAKKRLIAISKKKLPQLKEHGKYWGFIVKATEKMEEITHGEFDEKDYSTQTRGIRHLQTCRPAGEGVYAIVQHESHTHLVYVLEQPVELGPVQEAFNIEREGSYILTVKNPQQESGWGSWLKKNDRVEYPKELAEKFIGKLGEPTKWHPANPPQLLDYEGAELLFIGAKEDIVEELGETGEYLEALEKIDARRLTNQKLFQELHLDRKKFHPEPLLKGE